MVQNIEEFGPELGGEAFFEFQILHDRQIPILEAQIAEIVPARSTDGRVGRRDQDRVAFCVATAVRQRSMCQPGYGSSVQCHCFGEAGRIASTTEKGNSNAATRREVTGVTVEIPELSKRGELVHLVSSADIVGRVARSPR